MLTDADELTGTWLLQAWELEPDDAAPRHPFGADATGTLVYAADGWMHAAVARTGRQPSAAGALRRAPDAEVAEIARSYFSYGGRWWREADHVVHEVTIALDPDMVGSTQRRRVTRDGDDLELSADEVVDGRRRRHRLRWRRADTVDDEGSER